jgi:hypothetical protein
VITNDASVEQMNYILGISVPNAVVADFAATFGLSDTASNLAGASARVADAIGSGDVIEIIKITTPATVQQANLIVGYGANSVVFNSVGITDTAENLLGAYSQFATNAPFDGVGADVTNWLKSLGRLTGRIRCSIPLPILSRLLKVVQVGPSLKEPRLSVSRVECRLSSRSLHWPIM